MTKEQITYENVCEFLDEVVEVSNGDILCPHVVEAIPARIWKHVRPLPLFNDEFYLVVPTKQVPVYITEESLPGKYYIVDCFGEYKGNSQGITPRSLFVNFLFSSSGYNRFLKDGVVFKDIDRLYIHRTVSFFNNEESSLISDTGNENLEGLFTKWKTRGKKPLLILGERGIGKSWSVLNFCLEHSKLHNQDPWTNPLPIYINLRGLSENIPMVTNFGELLYYHLTTLYGIRVFGDQLTFATLLNTGRVILVLDGLDEMSKEVSEELTLKNLWQIFSLYSKTSKFILTSRRNFFSSDMQINEHFAFRKYLALRANNSERVESVYNLEEQRIRQNFNIWTIEPFENFAKTAFLDKVRNLSDDRLNIGREKYDRLGKCDKNTIQRELYELCDTPGYFLPVLKILASNQKIKLIDIFETCIDTVIIDFNIDTERAIDSYKTLDNSESVPSIKTIDFEASKKNEILRKLSWYMIERGVTNFNIDEFPRFIKEIEGNDYDIILNDLHTQTVITLDIEEGKYSFLTESIFAFYVANYLFLQLWDQDELEVMKGIRNLGRYDLEGGNVLRRAKIFLKEKIKSFKEKGNEGVKQLECILDLATKAFVSDSPYSPWLRHLSGNLGILGFNIDQELLNKRDFWILNPISTQNNRTDETMVLISGKDVDPFFLGVTEVTNSEYSEFLNSDEFKGDANHEECLGHHWRRSEVYGDKKKLDNPYLDIINYYHLIIWTNDKLPRFKDNHPVVWISWFAAAKYCNWLSLKESLPLYYSFHLENRKFDRLEINENSNGYRIPTEQEWMFAARSGVSAAKTLYDLFPNEKDHEMIKRRFFMESDDSTSPVKSENPNRFGVYGLMGNVREWVENTERPESTLKKFDEELIKGMGWLLGNEGFEFGHKSLLMAQNTNIDTGFRIARNLSIDELEKVDRAYSVI